MRIREFDANGALVAEHVSPAVTPPTTWVRSRYPFTTHSATATLTVELPAPGASTLRFAGVPVALDRRLGPRGVPGHVARSPAGTRYLHQDHLGSTSLVATAAGAWGGRQLPRPVRRPLARDRHARRRPKRHRPALHRPALAGGELRLAVSLPGALVLPGTRSLPLARSPRAQPHQPPSLQPLQLRLQQSFVYIDPTGYERVEGHYRDPGGSGQLWYGRYDDELDPADSCLERAT